MRRSESESIYQLFRCFIGAVTLGFVNRCSPTPNTLPILLLSVYFTALISARQICPLTHESVWLFLVASAMNKGCLSVVFTAVYFQCLEQHWFTKTSPLYVTWTNKWVFQRDNEVPEDYSEAWSRQGTAHESAYICLCISKINYNYDNKDWEET